jgi:hypothetical protein
MSNTVTNTEVIECGLGQPWGNFDGSKGIMPVAELEGHLEAAPVVPVYFGGLEELEIDWNVPSLPLALL